MRKKTDRFLHGYACACAVLAKLDTASDAQELLHQGGFTKKDLISEGIEKCDIEAIYPAKAKQPSRVKKQ